jgi:hypothetical protein
VEFTFEPWELTRQNGLHAYDRAVALIDDLIAPPAGSGEGIVLVDTVRPAELSAAAEAPGWEHLLAMLILTFPDVRWTFATCIGDAEFGERKFPWAEHDLQHLVTGPQRDTLFDPTGLREWVRWCTNSRLGELSAGDRKRSAGDPKYPFQMPERRLTAAAIDEESDYAYMHAYTAYRYGFRADAVTSWALMFHLFSGRDNRAEHGYELLIEDMRLAFPDKPASVHLSKLGPDPAADGSSPSRARGTRDTNCPLLDLTRDRARFRFMVTTGQQGHDDKLVQHNKALLRQRNAKEGGQSRGDLQFKPLGGICELWEKLGLTRDLHSGGRPGNADGYLWPSVPALEKEYDGHAAPGKLTYIAAALLRRAVRLKQSACAAADYVRVAVLSKDAAELLAGKTPTLTFAATALNQECEVRAECAFVGAGFHVRPTARLEELDAEIATVASWFHDDVSRRAQLDVRAGIANRLALAFRESGRMEEEHACLIELRRLNRKLSRPTPWWKLHLWPSHVVLAYGEWLLQSFGHLLTMIVVCVGIFAGLMWALMEGNYGQTFGHVVAAFFGGAPYNDPTATLAMRVTSWFAIGIGLFHLSVLISFVYSLISRK